jgi:hypothetical protein
LEATPIAIFFIPWTGGIYVAKQLRKLARHRVSGYSKNVIRPEGTVEIERQIQVVVPPSLRDVM